MPAVKRITLLRHAKAQQSAGEMADRDRPLNDRGRQDAPRMGRRLVAAGIRPSLIVTSPATRALQTAQLVAREIGYPLEFLQREPDLYLASPQEMLQVIARQDNSFGDILLCGHNPGITGLANQLTGAAIDNVPTCGIVVVEAEITSWSRLGAGARLCLFDFPKAHDPQGSRND